VKEGGEGVNKGEERINEGGGRDGMREERRNEEE
jgi:hypothetical protein